MKQARIVVMGLALALALFQATAPALAAAKETAPAKQVELNHATVEELVALPGVGEKLAARIIEYRDQNQGFKSVEELMNVKGIGEKSFQKLEALVRVASPAPRGASR